MLIRLFQQTTRGAAGAAELGPRYSGKLKQPDKHERTRLSSADVDDLIQCFAGESI